jgi:DNA-directed RNA polymerase specialized sigma24 family protein
MHCPISQPWPRNAPVRKPPRLLKDALADLPERSRIALEMYRFGGCRFSDIAGHLGVSVGTAHKLVVEALRHCRQRVYGGR